MRARENNGGPKTMPLGLFSRKFSRKSYSLRQDEASNGNSTSGGVKLRANGGRARHPSSVPTGILKKAGRGRPQSFPALSDGMVPQEMAAAIPMPSEPELNARFTEMVVCMYVVTY